MKKQPPALLILIPLVLILLFSPVSRVGAQLSTGVLPFGGMVSFKMTCDCSAGIQWIWFTPLYLGGPVVITGPVAYSPYSTTLYPWYLIGQIRLWHLGDYTPGVQACWIITGNSCSTLPAIGLMGKVGTNY